MEGWTYCPVCDRPSDPEDVDLYDMCWECYCKGEDDD